MTDTAETRAQESLECPECNETITGPTGGAGSAKFKLASHRYRFHQVRSSKTPKSAKGRSAPTDDEAAAQPVVGVLRDMQAQIPTGTGAPSGHDLTKALGRGVGLVSLAVAGYAVETDEGLTDAQRDQLADELSLTPRQAEDVVRPLAKAFAPTKLNRRFGRQVVENVDAVSSVAELTTLALSWRRYFKDRAVREGRRPAPAVVIDTTGTYPDGGLPPPPGPGPGGAAVDGMAPRNGHEYTTPAPQGGVVVSADMVRPVRGSENGAA